LKIKVVERSGFEPLKRILPLQTNDLQEFVEMKNSKNLLEW